jgi:hypothetical protein
MMKKNKLSLVALFLVVLFITGCSSGPKVFDKTVPLEESSTLVVNRYLSVEINGVGDVTTSMFNTAEVIIPAGKKALKVITDNGKWVGTVTTEFDFLPGHKYFLAMYLGKWGDETPEPTVTIVDEADLNAGLTSNPTGANVSPFEGEWESVTASAGQHLVFSGDQFILSANGKYLARGYWSATGKTVELTQVFVFDKDVWTLGSNPPIVFPIIYTGTVFTNRGGSPMFQRVQ